MNRTNIIIFTVLSLMIVGFVLGWTVFFRKTSHPKLKVMVYSSFLSPYGPAYDIQKKFEEFCQCRIQWMKVEDSTLMIQRLKLRSDGLGVDVVLGMDQLTFNTSKQKWKKITFSSHNLIPKAQKWIQPFNIPISWAPLTFIVRKPEYLPKNIESLLNPNLKKNISLSHPRSSTLGFQFYFWIFSSFKDTKKFLRSFKQQVYTVSHSWSSSYGLFQKEFTQLTFSYQTSVIYHLVEEKKEYFSARFPEGHPYQVELAAIPETCVQCDLAQNFLKFLLKKNIQKILMTKNYMFPVTQGVVEGTPFAKLEDLPLISYKQIDLFLSNKNKYLKTWDHVFY